MEPGRAPVAREEIARVDQRSATRPREDRPWSESIHMTDVSPYRRYSRAEWAHLRADTPLTLDEADLARLRGLNDPVSLGEVVEIYLPLSRLLSLYVEATQDLFHVTNKFLGAGGAKVPFVIGLAGSVAAASRPRRAS